MVSVSDVADDEECGAVDVDADVDVVVAVLAREEKEKSSLGRDETSSAKG